MFFMPGEKMIYILDGIKIEVTKKKIRSFRLRISRGGKVLCSVPFQAAEKQILGFIESKSKWIKETSRKAIDSSQKSRHLRAESVAFRLGLSESDFVSAENPEMRAYSKKWKSACKEVFLDSISRQLNFFEEGEIPRFTLKMRAMKSLWGSCSRRSNVVTLNYELLRFPSECVDYVVFHELTHFLYINHDKNFYGYISRFMPDYKERVKILKQ